MVFSRFIWTILAFILAIAATSVAFGVFLQKPGFPISVSFFAVLLILETFLLLWYLVRIRRDLLRLVMALKHEDTTLQFRKDSQDPYFSAIHREFNEIIRDFRLVRLDREAEQQFFAATVNHIRFGILAFDGKGNVEMCNEAFLQLFGLVDLSRLEELEEVSAGLPLWMAELTDGDETLRKLNIGDRVFHLIFMASRFRLKQRDITLVSVRDISREIGQNELEAWQKLMRVLRHEILNSITPIRLLSGSLSSMVKEENGRLFLPELEQEEIVNLKTGLDTIHRRAAGLSRFLDAYSNLYRVPELQITAIPVLELLKRVSHLYAEQSGNAGMEISLNSAIPDMEIHLDERMIEQVLINLVKNASEALAEEEEPLLELSARSKEGCPLISVKDNGPGIPRDQLDHIFIPFYSTREEGSGIGLSFAQHIMRLHKGRIHVRSSKGKGSEFQLIFPQNEPS